MATRRLTPSNAKKQNAAELQRALAELHAFRNAGGKLTGRKGALIVARVNAASNALGELAADTRD